MDRRPLVDARLLAVLAALAGLATSQACVEERERPKSPNVKLGGTGGTPVVTGPGGGSGVGGSAGQGGNIGTGGTSGAPDNCACIVNLSTSSTCTACQNTRLEAECGGVNANCEEDPECETALGCLVGCGDSLDPGPCIEVCLQIPQAAADLLMGWVDCVCDTACSVECDGDNTTCEPGTGGAGGMTGSGGNAGSQGT